MIKRPLNPQFSSAVLEGRKFTTIRETPWPVGVPIMLYNWSGAAYRSKQVDVAAVIVEATHKISMWEQNGTYKIRPSEEINLEKPVWECEGFASREDMDNWFRAVVKPGQVVTKHLMRFRLLNEHGDSAT